MLAKKIMENFSKNECICNVSSNICKWHCGRDIFSVLGLHVFKHRSSLGSTGKEYKIYVKNFVMLRKEPTRCQESKPQTSTP